MPVRRSRRTVYGIPTKPSAAPTTQVQIILESAFKSNAMIPATIQAQIPVIITATARALMS